MQLEVTRGLPQPFRAVLRRYAERGARIYRTDRDGAVTIAIPVTGAISVTPHRAVYRRYWQTQIENDPVPEPEAYSSRITESGGSESRRRDDH